MVAAAHINRITPATAVEPHYRNVRGDSIPQPGRNATAWELDSSRVLPKPCSGPSSPSPPESRDITLAQRQPIVKAEGIWCLRSLFLSRGYGLSNPSVLSVLEAHTRGAGVKEFRSSERQEAEK